MTDYIKRDDAINMVRNTFTGMTADTLELRINDIPPADVAPVRHGKWKTYKGEVAGRGYFYCTACHADVYDTSAYCPNCGAKMDEGELNGTNYR